MNQTTWVTFICQLWSVGSKVVDILCTMSRHPLFKSCHNLKYFFLYENMEALKKKLVLNPKAGFRKIKIFGFACCSSQSHESLLISLFLLSSRKIHLPTEFDFMLTNVILCYLSKLNISLVNNVKRNVRTCFVMNE